MRIGSPQVSRNSCQCLSRKSILILTRPEKSLHILVKNPDSNLHFLVSPEIALHLITGRSGSGQC